MVASPRTSTDAVPFILMVAVPPVATPPSAPATPSPSPPRPPKLIPEKFSLASAWTVRLLAIVSEPEFAFKVAVPPLASPPTPGGTSGSPPVATPPNPPLPPLPLAETSKLFIFAAAPSRLIVTAPPIPSPPSKPAPPSAPSPSELISTISALKVPPKRLSSVRPPVPLVPNPVVPLKPPSPIKSKAPSALAVKSLRAMFPSAPCTVIRTMPPRPSPEVPAAVPPPRAKPLASISRSPPMVIDPSSARMVTLPP